MASGGVYTEGSPIRDRDIATMYLRLILKLDGAALVKQFSHTRVQADDVWSLIGKVEIKKNEKFDQKPHNTYTTQVTITFNDGSQEQRLIESPTGGTDHPLSNQAIADKFKTLTSDLAPQFRMDRLQAFLLTVDKQERMVDLFDLLETEVNDALA